MGVFHSLLERLGFVRLRDYGLILTQDRRVVTTRPILDDGFGATVVGWTGDDLATMELAKKDGSEPAPAPIPEAPIAMGFTPAPVPAPLAVAAPVVTTPVVTAPVVAAPVITSPVAAPPPAFVVGEQDEPEDEWEWEIAAARARAAEVFERPARTPKATPAPPWRDDTAIRSVTQLAKMSEQVRQHELQSTAPRTIIPVPQLPTATAEEVTRQLPLLSPVVRRYRNAS